MLSVLQLLGPSVLGLLFAAGAVGISYWTIYNSYRSSAQRLATHTLGVLAPRLGLRIVQGSPQDSLAIPPIDMIVGGKTPGTGYQRVVRMVGAPRGRDVDVLHALSRSTDDPWFAGPTTTSTRRDAYVRVRIDPRVPSFEAASLRSAMGAPARMLPLPQVSAGRPDLDAEFAFASLGDAQLAESVCQQACRFSGPLRETAGVHLVCDCGWLYYSASELQALYVFTQIEEVIWGLEAIASALESRYVPVGYRERPTSAAVGAP
jgi:hypothetical protein